VWVLALGMMLVRAGEAESADLSAEDFCFAGPLGSEGAAIERAGVNHFKVTLGHAPGHPDWANMLQFRILQHAQGNAPRLEVFFFGGSRYRFNDYFNSWSYDGATWNPIHWESKQKDSAKGDTLQFPEFARDSVIVGHQVPLSYEMLTELVDEWRQHPCVTVHILGQSTGGRDIYRLTITDPCSAPPRSERWVHYVANQHPGEHNAQWRIVGMIQWLLRDAAANCRTRSIAHFVPMMSPDAPSRGWYRVCQGGVDMNRSYRVEGADRTWQPVEAYVVQKDIEALMASDTPITDLWSMHTWQGPVEPIVEPGPEMGTQVRSWEQLREIIEANDPKDLIKPLTAGRDSGDTSYWTHGPHEQFGITTVLCEGAGSIYTQHENIESGAILMKSLTDYYQGLRREER